MPLLHATIHHFHLEMTLVLCKPKLELDKHKPMDLIQFLLQPIGILYSKSLEDGLVKLILDQTGVVTLMCTLQP